MTRWAVWAWAFVLLAVLLPAAPWPARAQGSSAPPEDPASLIQVRAEAPSALEPGRSGVLRVRVTIAPGWHVNANPPTLDYLIPTEVDVTAPAGWTASEPRYPGGKVMRFAFADEPLSVYEGTVTIEVPIRAPANAGAAPVELAGEVRFQACNDELCLAPAAKPFKVTVGAAAPGGTAEPMRAESVVVAQDSVAVPDTGAAELDSAGASIFVSPGGMGGAAADVNPVRQLFQEYGLLAFFALFALGLGLNLTPCVYPMLSVTLALFGARTERRLWARVPPAFTYMLGIAMTYSVLGLVAALTGGMFGSVLQSPLVLVAIAGVLLIMAVSMFGFFELQLPSGLLTRLTTNTPTGLIGIFLSGVMVGVFAAPCVGPPIVALLAVVAQNGNPWFGFASFFVLSLGLGLPYLILGTFTGLLQRLPRSGDWMVWVKKVFGVLLIGVALFYLSLVVKPEWSHWVVPVVLIAGGIYLGMLEPMRERTLERRRRAGAGTSPSPAWTPFRGLQLGLGALAIAAGIWMVVTTPRGGIPFEPYTPARLEQARAEGRPVILDFYADWCVPCHELDRMTFTHPDVLRHTSSFVALKVDLTRYGSPESVALRERYQIPGVPTVIFLGADGAEVPDTRVVGFVPGPHFALLARRALETTVQPAAAR